MVNATLGQTVEGTLSNSSVTVPTGETWKISMYVEGSFNPYLNNNFMGNITNTPSGALEGIILTEGDVLENTASSTLYYSGSVVENVDNTVISDIFTSDINGEGGQSISNSRVNINIGSAGSWYIVKNGEIVLSNNDDWQTNLIVGPNIKIASGSNDPVFVNGFEV